MKPMNLHIFLTVLAFLGSATDPISAQSSLDGLTRQLDWVPQRSSSANPDITKNGDSRPIPPSEELVIADLSGPGVINHIWTTISSRDIFHGRSHVLRVYYDGKDKPSVQVPLGDFFGVGHGAAADYHSAVTSVSSHGRARACYWRMPFRQRAKVTVTNEGDIPTTSFYFYVDWEQHSALPEDTVYFHAAYRQENPTKPDDFLLLDTKGRGHYVGTVFSAHQAEIGWFGEGDDRFYVDGEKTPSLSGTGTEDYFGDAWGFRRFDTPYFGVPLWEGYMAGDRVTAYRWHLLDPVPFKKSLRVQMETRGSVFTEKMELLGQFLPRQDFVSAVAFWYQWPPVELTDSLPSANQRIAKYRIIPIATLKTRAKPTKGFAKSDEGVSYRSSVPDGELEIEFTVPEDGTYQVNAIIQYGIVGGVYQASLNGKEVGAPIDFSATGALDSLWTRFDLHKLHKDKTHTLKFVGKGQSPHVRTLIGPMHALSISHLVLLRLEDLPGYQAALKAAQKPTEQ
jgi:D-arabinan exo alpha-(1,3)/(1,5)-arabinofuranosidase (non-reducing end)